MKMSLFAKSILTISIALATTVACEKNNNKERDNFVARNLEAQKEKARYNLLSKEMSQKVSEYNKLMEEAQKLQSVVEQDKLEFDNQRKNREQQILDMDKQIQLIQTNMDAAKKNLGELQELAKTEEAKIATARQGIKRQQDALAADKTASEAERSLLANREAEIAAQEAQLETLKGSLDQRKALLDNQEGALEQSTLQFNTQLRAARELFLKENMGDAFEGVQQNQKIHALLTVRGSGSVKNIEDIRIAAKSFNQKQKKASLNDNVSYQPQFVLKTKNEKSKGKAIVKAVETVVHYPDFVYEKATETTTVRDSVLVYGTATEIIALRDELNKKLQTLEKTEGIESVSLWVIARPIREVRTALKMTLLGSNQSPEEKREFKTILAMDKIRAVDANIKNLDQVDLTKIEQLTLNGQADMSQCATVNKDCLVMLKKSGLLNHMITATFTNEDGTKTTRDVTYAEFIEQTMKTSALRIAAEKHLNGLQNGFSLNVRVTPAEWYQFWKSYSIDDAQIKEELEKLAQDMEKSSALLNEAILEKIVLEYSITMVDHVSNGQNPLDTLEYMESILNGGKTYRSRDELSRGEIEIPLPIKTKLVAESKFQDLTLSDVTAPAQLVAPVEPKAPAGLENGLPMHLSYIGLSRAAGETVDLSKLPAQDKKLVSQWFAFVEKRSAYDDALQAYDQQSEDAIVSEEERRKNIYFERADLHGADLRYILQALETAK